MSRQKLEDELRDRLQTRRLERVDVAHSGCISNGHCYTIDDDKNIFVKTNGGLDARVMFDGEFESLKAIDRTKTARVPRPLLVLHDYDGKESSAIVMEFLNICTLSDKCAKALGEDLADLHDYNNKLRRYNMRAASWIGRKPPSTKHILDAQSDSRNSAESTDEEDEQEGYSKHKMSNEQRLSSALNAVDLNRRDRFIPESETQEIGRFGFHVPTSCGSIPQVNEWNSDWISFYAQYRLDKPIRSLLSNHSDRELAEQWSHLQLKVDKFFADLKDDDNPIVPALLHGDLWSGNIAQLEDNTRAVIYDPSSFYGHSEYDFGIMRMFGGVNKSLEAAYFDRLPKRKLFEKRNKLYQLFHHLNHWDHFGSGYRPSSLRLIKELNQIV